MGWRKQSRPHGLCDDAPNLAVNEATIQVLGPDRVADALATAANMLNQMAWENAAGERLRYEIEIRPATGERVRTPAQNNALHKWLAMVAETLNAAGLDMKKVLRPEVSIPWSKASAKEFLWRPIQKVYTGKESSTEPSTKEYPVVAETIARHLGEKHGVTLPEWPTRGSQ